MLAQSGCRMLFTGLESFNPEAIAEMNKRQNIIGDTRRVIDLCHENGISLISPLLLNAQVDTIGYIRSIPERLRESGLMVPAFFAFESPIPGTPLFHRMAAESEPAFLPNAMLCDFNGDTMVLRPRRASLEAFVDAYRQTLAEVTSPAAKLRQIWENAPRLPAARTVQLRPLWTPCCTGLPCCAGRFPGGPTLPVPMYPSPSCSTCRLKIRTFSPQKNAGPSCSRGGSPTPMVECYRSGEIQIACTAARVW